jgi:hypothetical protein
MSACPDIRARLASYSAEELSGPQRREVREHLAGCRTCREAAVTADPTLLFAGAAPVEDVSAADMARILEGVRVGVALKQAERRLAMHRKPGRRTAAVAAAAAVVLFTLALPGGLSPRASAPAARATAGKTVTPGFAKASVTAPADASGGATVYEIAPGSGPDNPRVVWIVDRSLDI